MSNQRIELFKKEVIAALSPESRIAFEYMIGNPTCRTHYQACKWSALNKWWLYPKVRDEITRICRGDPTK